jgi:hypothetical protein
VLGLKQVASYRKRDRTHALEHLKTKLIVKILLQSFRNEFDNFPPILASGEILLIKC